MREATPKEVSASAFQGYTIIVSWQDGWSCRWHGDSIPDVTQLEAMRPGVWSVTSAADEPPQTPSQQIHTALVERRYRFVARRYAETDEGQYRQLDYYGHRDRFQLLLLEIILEKDSRSEAGCNLWRLVTHDTSI